MTEDEMVGWHHRLNGHEFEQAAGDSEGQGSLVCCSPWGCIELNTTAAKRQQQQHICCNFLFAALFFVLIFVFHSFSAFL